MGAAPEARIDRDAGDVLGVLIDVELGVDNSRVDDMDVMALVEKVIVATAEFRPPEVGVSLTNQEAWCSSTDVDLQFCGEMNTLVRAGKAPAHCGPEHGTTSLRTTRSP
jgi:hypothetical protein